MTELEQRLVRLGAALDFPVAPDVAETVRDRLEAGRAPRRFRLPERRTLALVLAILAVTIGAAMAVPPARTAILEFFGLQGATVRRVETLPRVSERIALELELGREATLAEARSAAAFPLLVPEELGGPDRVFVSDAVPGSKVSLLYGPRDGIPRSRYTGVGVLVTEFDGKIEPEFIGKLAGQATKIEQLSVDGERAIWLEGGPHAVFFSTRGGTIGEDTARLAGNTLLVQQGSVLVRLEGELSREQAVRVARSLG